MIKLTPIPVQYWEETHRIVSSTNSFSMLPSKPHIFYGRESELQQIMELLQKESSRIAILGGGGMGKTSLARAVLHHPDTSAKFKHRFFVSAESATNRIELAALIGLHPTDHQLETSLFVELILSKYFTDPVLECKFYLTAGHHFLETELDAPHSLQFFDKALQLSKLCGDKNEECNSLIWIAMLEWSTGDFRSAKVHVSEAQRLSKLSGNLFQEAQACGILASCTRSVGNWQKSMTTLYRARELLSLCGMSRSGVDHEITIEQAEIHLAKFEYAEARRLYSQMVETTSPDHNAHACASALLNIAEIDIMIGQPAQDVDNNLSKAKVLFSSMNMQKGIIFCDMLWADVECRVGKTAKILETLHSAWGKEHQIMSFCLERLSNVNAWQSAGSQSRWPVVYLGYAHKSKDKLALHKALLYLGDVFISHDDEETAQNLWIVALEGFTSMDVHCSRAQCMLHLGDLAEKRGEISAAIEFWKSARPLFERSLQAKDVAQIDLRLAALEEAHQSVLTTITGLHPPILLLDQLSISKEVRSGVEEVEETEEEIGTDLAKAILPIAV
ncbi:hypothetical protein DFH08DRAFT_826484 [Mycena albidolilacea]|uniref:Novel STAND NTPase 1 domain-containing protein n=1 Tax=Mycena albidolilacea TaxID=1033008 RepID=A0AAD6Z092_9AGAR|nr:hypothetical protein DFH08DRAFT_826484 [Mycena albidolilacea]